MGHHLRIINLNPVKALEEVQCGKKRFAEISTKDFEIKAEEIKPPEGFKPPEKFPRCCEFHGSIFDIVQAWYEKFPKCCKSHERLLKERWFEKTNYQYVAKKVVDQLSYTEHII